MAKTTIITDDIDGSANARTVSFSLDGRSFEVDLNAKNTAALKAALKPYIDAAQKATGATTMPKAAARRTSTATKPARRTAAAPKPAARRTAKAAARRPAKAATSRAAAPATSGPVDLPAVRAWAATQGVAVATRGRVASSVVDAFRKAHG